MSTVRAEGVRFRIYPQDHEPIHAHGRFAETVAVVELSANDEVRLANRADSLLPKNAKPSDVKKILRVAQDQYEAIVAAWEKMQR